MVNNVLEDQQLASSDQQDVQYVVQTGDTLVKIAKIYYCFSSNQTGFFRTCSGTSLVNF